MEVVKAVQLNRWTQLCASGCTKWGSVPPNRLISRCRILGSTPGGFG